MKTPDKFFYLVRGVFIYSDIALAGSNVGKCLVAIFSIIDII